MSKDTREDQLRNILNFLVFKQGGDAHTGNLVGIDLNGEILSGIDFCKCDIDESNFSKCELSGSNLRGTTLRSADFRKANIQSTEFDGANCAHAKFNDAHIKRTSFSGCDVTHANFSGAFLQRVQFQRADLAGANFENAVVKNCDFSGANLTGVHLTPEQLQAMDRREMSLPQALEFLAHLHAEKERKWREYLSAPDDHDYKDQMRSAMETYDWIDKKFREDFASFLAEAEATPTELTGEQVKGFLDYLDNKMIEYEAGQEDTKRRWKEALAQADEYEFHRVKAIYKQTANVGWSQILALRDSRESLMKIVSEL